MHTNSNAMIKLHLHNDKHLNTKVKIQYIFNTYNITYTNNYSSKSDK